MEKNTVCLDIEKYNDLRDFKQNFEDGKTIIATISGWNYYCQKMKKQLEKLQKQIKIYKKKMMI